MKWEPISTAPRDGTLILAAESYYRDEREEFSVSGHPRVSDPSQFTDCPQRGPRPAIAVVWLPHRECPGWYNAGSWQRMVTFDPDVWTHIDVPGRVPGWPG